MMKTFIKKVHLAISAGNQENAFKKFKDMQKILDRLVSKKIIHKNKASRYKSNLYLKIKQIVPVI